MAEKESNDALESSLLDENNLNIASKDPSRPMLIKIILGLLALLILIVGVYFFFMLSDKPAAEAAVSGVNEKNILPEIAPPATTSEPDETKNDADNTLETSSLKKEDSAEQLELVKMREETAALKQENLKIKEQLKKLEAKQNADLAATKAKIKIANTKNDKQITEKTSKLKVEKNPYANLYVRNDHLIRQPRREQPHEPMIEQAPPEPKWGNFDPLYRGE